MLFTYPHTDAEIAANRWEEITEKEYYDLLGAVPPKRNDGLAFALGEELCHTNDGRAVYLMCVKVGERHYKKPGTEASFSSGHFADEVRKQLISDAGPKLLQALKQCRELLCILSIRYQTSLYGDDQNRITEADNLARQAIANAQFGGL